MLLLLATALLCTESQPTAVEWERARSAPRSYASDFFVFIGECEGRRAVFAADFNRGKKDSKAQNEQWFVLHIEKQGWAELAGGGEYKVKGAEPLALRDSAQYSFSGDDAQGWTLKGSAQHPGLSTQALQARSAQRNEKGVFARSSGPAALTWKDRTYVGAALREFTLLPGMNLISDPDAGLFGDGWNGLYALRGRGDKAELVVFHQTGGELKSLLNPCTGFVATSPTLELAKANFRADAWEQAAGFFRWPGRWRVDPLPNSGRIEVKLEERDTLISWVVGGACVAIARGEMQLADQKLELYGLAQVVR
jgi:hypothetical protein